MSADGLPAPDSPDLFTPPSAETLSELLPHYDISQLIAVGGMGAVYAGKQIALDRPVAIKILPPGIARDMSAIHRFRTEAKAMARLTHLNIPTVYDFDFHGGYCYLVMEYVNGKNVHQLIREKGALPPALAMNYLGQVCDALTFAHQSGVIHGDIKPSNLLVNQQGVVKLADFGLAQLLGHAAGPEGEGARMGTPEYAAPELWNPEAAVDQRSDLYSLGAVFFEMLTGAAPQGEFQLPSSVLRIDPHVDTIIVGCMKPDPDQRYQTAAQVRQVLDTIEQKAAAAKATPAVKVVRRGPRRRAGSPGRQTKRADYSPIVWIFLVLAVVVAVYLVARHRSNIQAPVTKTPQEENIPGARSR